VCSAAAVGMLAAQPAGSSAPATAIVTPASASAVEVLRLLARGLRNAELAAELTLSDATVKTHVARILAKLQALGAAKVGEQRRTTPYGNGMHIEAVLIDKTEPARDWANWDWANWEPPCATISPPGSVLSRPISCAVSPRAIRDSGQPAESRVLENTTLGMSFIMAATGSVDVGQVSAIDW
jgi:Bacterial regulatory proteins, luxR family